jgi:hypothetical protein
MILPLLRHPLSHLLARLWWLPVMTATLVWGYWGGHDLHLAGVGAAAGLGAIAGVFLIVAAHGPYALRRESARRRRAGHRFLCPSCLEFDDFRFACSTCRGEIPASLVATRGIYGDACPRCRAPLDTRQDPLSPRVTAYCRQCAAPENRWLYHRRQVRVVGTFSRADFSVLLQALGQPVPLVTAPAHAYDDGTRLTYLLSLDEIAPGTERLSALHAGRAVDALWLEGREAEPLALGAAVDRFLQRAALSKEQLRAMTVCVGQEWMDPAAQNLLAARFGTVRYGVEPAAFLALAAAERTVILLPRSAPTPQAPERTSGQDLDQAPTRPAFSSGSSMSYPRHAAVRRRRNS